MSSATATATATKPKNPPGCCTNFCNKFQNGVNVFGKKVLEGYSINRIAKSAIANISLVSALYPLQEGWHNLKTVLVGCVTWLDLFDIINRAREWLTCEIKGMWRIISRVCLTAFQIIGVIKFLDYLKFIDINNIIQPLSRIPVIGFIVGLPHLTLITAAYLFSLINNATKLSPEGTQAILSEAKREACEIKKNALEGLKSVDPYVFSKSAEYHKLHSNYLTCKEKIKNLKKSLGEKVCDIEAQHYTCRFEKLFTDVKSEETVSKLKIDELEINLKEIKKRVAYHKVQAHNGNVTWSKTVVGIISDLSKTIFLTCGLIGVFTEISFLAFTSIPMLTMGAISALAGVFKVFYDIRSLEPVPELPPVASKSKT